VIKEPLSGSSGEIGYSFTEIRRFGILNKDYLMWQYFGYNPVRIYLNKPPFYIEVFGWPGREKFGPITRMLGDAMMLIYKFGRGWHGDFLIKSNDMRAAAEFCDRNKVELAGFISGIVWFTPFRLVASVAPVPVRAEIKKGGFRMTVLFIEGSKKERMQKVLELGSIIANREYR
jgi:hypothetical protein